MSSVTLHVGAFKTGTTYVQQVMSNNRETLARNGVLWPGETYRDQVRAARGVLSGSPGDLPDWERLVDQIDAWDGDSAVISMESLSLADPGDVKRAVESLHQHHVKIVLSVRDLGRIFPAQWQESIQNKWSWSYQEYIDGVICEKPGGRRAWRHFWSKHEWSQILRIWGELVPTGDMVIVTVPPSGASPGLLWERIGTALGLNPSLYDSSMRANESLGAASAEVMRHVTAELNRLQDTVVIEKAVKRSLTKHILVSRKNEEPKLILPEEHREWAIRESDRLASELKQSGVRIIGDLNDLTPRFVEPSSATTSDPATLPTNELLTAAAHGIVALCAELSEASDLDQPLGS